MADRKKPAAKAAQPVNAPLVRRLSIATYKPDERALKEALWGAEGRPGVKDLPPPPRK